MSEAKVQLGRMRYRINSFLDYDAAEGILRLTNSNTPETQLSITANAVLYVLLQKGGIVTREEVMKKVWDDNGLISSNSNLNQYISLLRKAFRNYGLDNVIVTVPRSRLEINPALEIEILDNNPLHPVFQHNSGYFPQSETEAPVTNASEPKPASQPTSLLSPKSEDYNWICAAVAVLFVALITLMLTFGRADTQHMMTLIPVENSGCELLSTDALLNPSVKNKFISNFHAVRNKLNLKCEDGQNFLFYYGAKLQTNELGRTFLSRCVKNGDNPFSYCDNYFYYAWK